MICNLLLLHTYTVSLALFSPLASLSPILFLNLYQNLLFLSNCYITTSTSNNDSVLCSLILSVGLALVCLKSVYHLLMLADALRI